MILNLTMHDATPDQVEAGVRQYALPEVKKLLNFEELPTQAEMHKRAVAIVEIARAQSGLYAMIGGAPYFMEVLKRELENVGIQPLYSFSKREVVETHNPDGTVTKTSVFKHVGFL